MISIHARTVRLRKSRHITRWIIIGSTFFYCVTLYVAVFFMFIILKVVIGWEGRLMGIAVIM